MNNYKTVFFAIGVLLIILGAFMLIPFFIQFIYGEKNSTFLSSASVTAFIGILLVLTNLEENRKLNLQQAFLLTTLSWLSIAIFGCIPFLLSDLNLSFVDAFFESMSGITTTGSTIITNLDNAPKSILIWRAILQWLGGIGIIVMAITILPLLNIGGMQLFRMESSDTTEKILPRAREVTIIISIIYLTLTFVCGIAYWLVGMNIFDSIAHSMTTIATGGFSTYSSSIGYFQNSKIEIIAIIFIFKYARKQQENTGKQIPKFFISLGLLIIFPLLTFLVGGVSLSFEYPVLTQLSKTIFNYMGGVAIIPELMALAAALSLYTATFIAECVRAGIMGVTKGQKEAAASIGLTPGQILRLVIMPQALRIIIPPTTNQYLNLTKNSSLAAAIAYPDIVLVFAGTAMMQTGRAIEIVSITMLTYLSISIVISIFMNWYNQKMAIKEK